MQTEIPLTVKKVVGTRETVRSIDKDLVSQVFIARDAEKKTIQRVMELCREKSIPINEIETMEELGRLCSVQVSTAVAAILK